MLETLLIKHFQAHRSLRLDFDPLVTTLVGPSDVGKSAVVRALRWLATNRPSGCQFIRWGSSHVSVRLKLDGHEVLRERAAGINAYSLDGHRYQAFGAEVPPEIAALLNVGEVNWQGQLDPPWYLLNSPGEVSRALNSVVDLGLIDSTLANLAAAQRQARAEVGVCGDRLAAARGRAEGLAWVVNAHTEYTAIQQQGAVVAALRNKRAGLAALLAGVGEAGEAADLAATALPGGLAAVELGGRALELGGRVAELRNYVGKLGNLKAEAGKLGKQAREAKTELYRRLQGRCPVCGGDLPG